MLSIPKYIDATGPTNKNALIIYGVRNEKKTLGLHFTYTGSYVLYTVKASIQLNTGDFYIYNKLIIPGWYLRIINDQQTIRRH